MFTQVRIINFSRKKNSVIKISQISPMGFSINHLHGGFHVCKKHVQRQGSNYLVIKPRQLVYNPNKTVHMKSLKEPQTSNN